MLWLLATIATAGLGGLSVFVALRRMEQQVERVLRDAPRLTSERLVEGAYGRIEGRARSQAELVMAPGLDRPCVLYELVVWQRFEDGSSTADWGEVHRSIVGGELLVDVDGVVVRVDAQQVQLVTAPVHDHAGDLRPGAFHRSGPFTSRIRYVVADADVQVVGTVSREVDADPGATRDYREIATRLRMIAARNRPLVLAARPQRP